MIMDEYGILLVTCPNCGAIMSTYLAGEDGQYSCTACGQKEDINLFPDFFT